MCKEHGELCAGRLIYDLCPIANVSDIDEETQPFTPWRDLTVNNVNEDGYYWYREHREAPSEIVYSQRDFGGDKRTLVFFTPQYDPNNCSVDTLLNLYPNAQISSRIEPPEY